MKLNEIVEQLAELTNGLHEDVSKASTRVEHIRLTARANEAVNILHNLMLFQDGSEAKDSTDDQTKTADGE